MIYPTPNPSPRRGFFISEGFAPTVLTLRLPTNTRVNGAALNPQKDKTPLPGKGLEWGS